MELERLYFNNSIMYIPKINNNYYPIDNNLILTTDTTNTTNCTNLIYDLINNVINYILKPIKKIINYNNNFLLIHF